MGLKVGITGGIGSGKTTVCRVFETLGIPVYYADHRAKELMIENSSIIEGITKVFGATAYTSDGQLNRKHIAQIAFADKSKLALLNGIVHPVVFADAEAWHHQHPQAPYTLKEAALLYETEGYKLMDKMITVFAPQNIRIQRVMQRDGVKEEDVRARMTHQMPDEKKIKLADFIVYNDTKAMLIPQILQIHKQLTLHSHNSSKQ